MKNKEEILKEFDEKFKNYNFYSSLDFKGEVKTFISQALSQTREETIREIEERINQIKEAVRKNTGSFKYDSCYDDYLDILNTLK